MTGQWTAGWRTDVIHATRLLMRRPGHTLAVVSCLAVGLTVSIATFSVLLSLVYGDQPGIVNRREVVRIYLTHDAPAAGGTHDVPERVSARPFSMADFAVFRQPTPALGSIAGEAGLSMAVVGRHGAIGVTGAFVSGNYFEELGTVPHFGRLLAPADESPNAEPVVAVGEHFWRTHLDASPDAIGSSILLAGRSFTVIGVAPPRFHGVHVLDFGQDDSHGLQVWIPLQHAASWPGAPARGEAWLTGIGRLRPGRTADEARAQLAVSAARLSAEYPSTRANTAVVVRARSFAPSDTPVGVLMVLGAILGLPLTVLAIGCANVANLQLARSAERTRELAIRLSFGASRWQLVRLLTIETSGLAALSAGVSAAATAPLFRFAGPFLPFTVSLDWSVAAFTLALTMAVTFSTGLVPAWLVLRNPGAAQVRQNAQSGGIGYSRLRSSLVAAQVALSLLMLCGSGVLLRTINSMNLEVPPALRSQIIAEFDPGQAGGSQAGARLFAEELAARLNDDPRVAAVSLSRAGSIRYVEVERDRSAERYAALIEMTPSWLEVMDLPILAGRALTGADGPEVALVSARLAESVAPGGSPLGKLLLLNDGIPSIRRVEIVGVVADNRTRPMQIGDRPDPAVYVAMTVGLSRFTIHIRTNEVEAVSSDLRTIVRELDPRLPWLSLQRGEELYMGDAGGLRSLALSIGGLGLLSLALAATGLYAIMAYLVLLRRHEIGVRVAIGADPRQIVGMVLRQALTMVLAGSAIGLGLAIPLMFALRAVFVGTVSPLDPAAFLPPLALLIAVALIAAALPARRAASVDPIHTLRQD